jgi:hypothetical protein
MMGRFCYQKNRGRDVEQIKTTDVHIIQLVWKVGRTLKTVPRKTKRRVKEIHSENNKSKLLST